MKQELYEVVGEVRGTLTAYDRQPKPCGEGGHVNGELKKNILICSILVATVFLTSAFVIKPITVSGESMADTYEDGDYRFVNRLAYVKVEPQRGDIIVFKHEKRLLIKRVIAKSGDEIEIIDGWTRINGKFIDEPYVKERWVGSMEPLKVPSGEMFVMGDNRNNSLDSRGIGCVKQKDILGRVVGSEKH